MPGNEEGEFELVLGNKQLLSVFFVVVVLLGVFFTMGYVVGRNTAQVQVAAALPEPLVVEAGGASGGPEEVASAEEPAPSVQTAPSAQSAPVPEPPRLAQVEPPKPAPAPSTPKPKPVSSSALNDPPAGTVFLQIAATTDPEASMLLEVMERRGFAGRLAPVPGEDLKRVLIGPLSGGDEYSETREKLREAGFEPFRRTY